MKCLIAANPYGGADSRRRRVEALATALERAGVEAELVWDQDRSRSLIEAPDCADRFGGIVSAGGDGTLFDVVNLRPTVPVTMFPLGNENLFARAFDLPVEADRAAEMVAAGKTRRIDLGNVGDKRFTLVASAGFDGRVAHRVAEKRMHASGSKQVGRHSYMGPIVSACLGYRFPMMHVAIDGAEPIDAALVMVFNLNRYGLGLPLAPDAAPDDGQLDWLVFRRPGRFRLMRYAAAVVLNRHRRLRDVRHGRARSIRVEAAGEPVPVEIDGEAAGFTPIEVTIEPAALDVIVP
ncbi:MAG: diacylglycerol kinase family protein [Phycisphaeraceae bacterium]|nr:diacylglycerol kinase family protein [Phycisphaeraceae bacterium]